MTDQPPRRGVLPALAVFAQRRTLVMLALGFASGLPNLLIFDALSAWLRESGLSLQVIGLFSLATLVFGLKFLWAPLLDHLAPPFLTRWLGKRRAWMLVTQAAIIVGLLAISTSDPARNLPMVAVFAVWTGFFGATQDIVIDAWRIEVADVERQGAMAAAYQWGYRIAIVTAGAAPLALAQFYGWHVSYTVMAALMVIGVGAVLLAPIPAIEAQSPNHEGAREPRGGVGAHLRHAVVDPFIDFFRRFAWAGLLVLALICVYRLSDFVLNIMNPYYLDLGFTKTQIAEARKIFGVAMSMLGVFSAGFGIARFGLFRPLVIGALAAPLTHLSFAWLTTQGPNFQAFLTCIALDNFAGGFAGTCLIAYMSSLTTAGFTATQYALFSSLYALPGKLIAAYSGRIIEGLAHAAAPGGPLANWTGLFAKLPAQSFRAGAAKLGVPPAALATGYAAYFFYACLIGAAGIVLAVIVASLRIGGKQGSARDAPMPAIPQPSEPATSRTS